MGVAFTLAPKGESGMRGAGVVVVSGLELPQPLLSSLPTSVREKGSVSFLAGFFQKATHRATTKSREIPGEEGASLEVGVISANKEGSNSSISEKEMG